MKRICCFVVSLVVLSSLFARADINSVLSIIEEAVKQYQAGDYAGAASNLDYASQLIRQKKSENMKQLLPEPLPGWTAGDVAAHAIGSDVLGGGVTVSRDYYKDDASLNLEIGSDSPVLQSVQMMVNNSLFAGAGGGKLKILKEQKAIIKYDETKKSGDVYVVVADKFMVTIKGNQVSRESLIQFAESVDYEQLSAN